MAFDIRAVVVTYNRLAQLQACIERVRHQTYALTEILVIDSSSTDGTCEWLDAQRDLHVIHQENLGCGAGFANGMELAYDHGAEWCWLLDDDCLPEYDALERLTEAIAAYPGESVFNSLCLAKNDPTRPTHGAVCLRKNDSEFLYGEYVYNTVELYARAGTAGILDSVGGQLYLGTLIHRRVIERVGLPLGDYFIWGDEIDYSLRMMQAGYRIWVVTSSVNLHPGARISYLHVFSKRLPCERMPPLKRYYNIRNSIYIRKKFYAGQAFLPYVARRVAGAMLTDLVIDHEKNLQAKWASCRATLRGARDGLRWQVNGAA